MPVRHLAHDRNGAIRRTVVHNQNVDAGVQTDQSFQKLPDVLPRS